MKQAKRNLFMAISVAVAGVVLLFIPEQGITPFKGEELFAKHGCDNCHTFKGRGGNMGPDLTAVTLRRKTSWLQSYIREPASRDKQTRMPPFHHLSTEEIKSIIAYLND